MSMLDAALTYAARGWYVFPLRPRDKRPATARGFKDATRDEQQIRAWWSENQEYNIGIATGATSGIVVIDTDNAAAEEYVASRGDVQTLMQQTAHGRHRFYRAPGYEVRNTTRLHGVHGLDVRGDGGYIVAAPSLHPTGARYAWLNDATLAEMPAWILQRKAADAPDSATTDRYADAAYKNCLAELAAAPVGGRNDTLNKVAFRLYRLVAAGRLPESAVNALEPIACSLGLQSREIAATLASARRAGLNDPDFIGAGTSPAPRDEPRADTEFIWRCYDENEAGDAQLFARLYRDTLVFDHAQRTWFAFVGPHWKECDAPPYARVWGGVAGAYISEAARLLADASKEHDDSRKKELSKQADALQARAKLLRSRNRINNVLVLATELVGVTSDAWNRDPWLLAVKNGVLDLRTGDLRTGEPGDYIRTVSPVFWRGLDEPAPRWKTFVSEIMSDEADRIAFLQRVLGYALNGTTREHIMCLLLGDRGRNGKRVLCETVAHVLGEYAKNISTDVVVGNNKFRSAGSAQPHLVALRGVRFAVCSETSEHDSLTSAQVKNITGGDAITARDLHEKLITFSPTHTLFLQTNYKPHAPADDDALWERVKVIEFKTRFVDEPNAPDERARDAGLEDALRAEASGILAWLVRGHIAWLHNGLQTPASVKVARDRYRNEESLDAFFDACCTEDNNAVTEASVLYDTYARWCALNGYRAKSVTWFGKQVSRLYDRGRTTSGRNCYFGVAVKTFTAWKNSSESPNSSETIRSASERQETFVEAEESEEFSTFFKSSKEIFPHEEKKSKNYSDSSDSSDTTTIAAPWLASRERVNDRLARERDAIRAALAADELALGRDADGLWRAYRQNGSTARLSDRGFATREAFEAWLGVELEYDEQRE